MLNRMGLTEHEEQIRNAVFNVFREGRHTTRDVGGQGNTSDFVKAIIDKL